MAIEICINIDANFEFYSTLTGKKKYNSKLNKLLFGDKNSNVELKKDNNQLNKWLFGDKNGN